MDKQTPFSSLKRAGVMVLAVSVFLTGCAFAQTPAKDDFKIVRGKLFRDTKAFTLEAIRVPGLGESDASLKVMVPALARIAEVGGNAVCFDLGGFSADGAAITPQAVETVKTFAVRCKDQRMGVLVRVLGDSTDPEFRKKATLTAAKALGDEARAVYWFDGPDADALAKLFKKKASKPVVAAPENGDILVMDAAPADLPKKPVLVANSLPTGALDKVNFVLPGSDADYAALEAALTDPVEKAPWTPDNSVLSEAERAEGFIALFDGKTLDGWWVKDENKKAFGVNPAGFIEWQQTGGGALMTRDRYDNFILRMEWMIEKNGNSGVWCWAPRGGRQSKIGFEVQMRGDSDVTEMTKDNSGAIYDVLPPACNAVKPEGEWNDLEVVCQGSKVKVTLNGKVVQDLNFDDHEELRYRLRKGFISVTDHGNYCGFRNIRLKKL